MRTMRKQLFERVQQLMREDERFYLLTADLGYYLLDEIREEFPLRFFNVGASEQFLVGAGVGLALSGKIPICYSITPFLLCRPFEIIRNYLNHEKIPVKLIGGGRGKDYGMDGFTHWAEDDDAIIRLFPNIQNFRPETQEDLDNHLERLLLKDAPVYINVSKK